MALYACYLFQNQNQFHNKSTQQESMSIASLGRGGMTHRIMSQTGFPNKYFLLLWIISLLSNYCLLLCTLKYKNVNWKPWGRNRGEASKPMALNQSMARSNQTLLTSLKSSLLYECSPFLLGLIEPRAARQGGNNRAPGRGLNKSPWRRIACLQL